MGKDEVKTMAKGKKRTKSKTQMHKKAAQQTAAFKTKRQRTGLETLLEVISIVMVIVGLVAPIVMWGRLPDELPTHFTAEGVADAWSKKAYIWVMPVLGLLMYLVTSFSYRSGPKAWRIPFAVNEAHAKEVYEVFYLLLQLVKAECVTILSLLTLTTLFQIALPAYTTMVLIGITILTIALLLLVASRKNKGLM